MKPYIGKDIGNFVNVITVPQLAYGFFDLTRNQPSFPACNFLLILVKAVIAFPTIYLSFSFFLFSFWQVQYFRLSKIAKWKDWDSGDQIVSRDKLEIPSKIKESIHSFINLMAEWLLHRISNTGLLGLGWVRIIWNQRNIDTVECIAYCQCIWKSFWTSIYFFYGNFNRESFTRKCPL